MTPTVEKIRKWRLEIALGVATVILFVARLGKSALRDYDEALYALVARDIYERGEWLSLSVAGSYYSHKPPLMFWLMALSYEVFGVNELAARLPSALFAIAGVAATYLLTLRLFDRKTALLAAVILLTAPQWLALGRQAMLDVAVASLFIVAAIGALRRSWLIAGICLGAALLIKGPLVLLAIASALVASVFVRDGFGWFVLKSALLAFAIAAPWHIHQIALHGSDFTAYYFGTNLVTRLTTGMEGHAHGWSFYFHRVFFQRLNPWHVGGAVALGVWTWRAMRRRAAPWLPLWFWVPFLVLTIARTKLRWYVTPVYPPLAIMTAASLVEWSERARWVRRAVIVLTALTLLQSFHYSFRRGTESPTEDTRTVLRSLPPKDVVPQLALTEGTPHVAARFYADRSLVWCTETSPPPVDVWILTTPERAAAFPHRPVVASTRTRVLLGPTSQD